MAEKTSASSSGDQNADELACLKSDLEVYRELILPLNKVVEWEQNYYPGILVGVITLIFSVVWYLEPSVLTTFCILGVIVCAMDFTVPIVTAHFFKSEWTVVQERQFDAICVRILNAKRHISNIRRSLVILKRNKPNVYLLVMMGAFSLLAWFGSLIDNLLLTYLLVIAVALVPGLRKHGILQQVTKQISSKLSGLQGKGPAAASQPKKSD